MKNIRILLIGNRELIYRGVRSVLENEEDINIIGICSSAKEVIVQVTRLRPDILILDTQTPGMNGIDIINQLKKKQTGFPIEIIVFTESFELREKVIQAGVKECFVEDINDEELIQVIRNVYKRITVMKENNHLIENEEMIELVIPPSSSSANLLQFMCQIAERYQGEFTSIVCATGSWDRGATITLRSQHGEPLNLQNQLTDMPGVNKVEEQILTEGIFPGYSSKFEILSRIGINPTKRLCITLDENI